MAVIIEVLGWGGKCREHFSVNKQTVTIGRSYENDVVLSDNHISGHHLRLDAVGDNWQLTDLDSLNGTQVVRNSGGSEALLASGSEIKLGRTRLRILRADHPIEPAKPLHRLDREVGKLGKLAVWLPLLIAVVGFEVIELYLHSVTKWEWKNIIAGLLNNQLTPFLIAAFWALIGRLIRHEGNFFGQLSLILIASLIYTLSSWLWRVTGYNASTAFFTVWVAGTFNWILLALLLSANIALATNLLPVYRWISACGITVLIVVMTLANSLQRWGEFSPYPKYYSELEPPILQFSGATSREAFISEAEQLFDEADDMAREK